MIQPSFAAAGHMAAWQKVKGVDLLQVSNNDLQKLKLSTPISSLRPEEANWVNLSSRCSSRGHQLKCIIASTKGVALSYLFCAQRAIGTALMTCTDHGQGRRRLHPAHWFFAYASAQDAHPRRFYQSTNCSIICRECAAFSVFLQSWSVLSVTQ